MNYKHHYYNLINKAKNRILDCYTETHHVQPRCMGGSEEKHNLVKLTAKEHFLAHKLLVKMYPQNSYLVSALFFMSKGTSKNPNRGNSKVYSWLREKWSKAQKGKFVSEKTRLRQSIAHKNKPLSAKQIAANTARRGRKPTEKELECLKLGRTPEAVAKRGVSISKAKKGKPQSKKHIEALSKVRRGRILTQEHKQKISQGHKRRREEKERVKEDIQN